MDEKILCQDLNHVLWEKEFKRIYSLTPYPVWHPHRYDMASWHHHRDPHFLERGIYSHRWIEYGDTVLDLCCGDGFYPFFFYSTKASAIDAVDINEEALKHARTYHSADNISYYNLNICMNPFPRIQYDSIIWNSAIRRLSIVDMECVFDKIKAALKPGGTFTAYEVFNETTEDVDFITKMSLEELVTMLEKRFSHVNHFRTVTRELYDPNVLRTNYYFDCRH